MIKHVIARLRNSAEAISKTDGKIALTALGIAALLLLIVFMVIPIRKAGAGHCAGILCAEDIANTKHNLNSNTDIGPISGASGLTEICIFCHTPHGARSTIGNAPSGQAPIWNRALKTPASYTIYTSPNFDGEGITPGRPKGVSLACLSCHDGTIAFDALINPPGSGGFIPSNLGDIVGPGTRMGATFPGFGADTDANGTMDEAQRMTANTGGFLGGLANFATSLSSHGLTPYPNLTTDISDDHPISMRMPSGDPQFEQARTNSGPLNGAGSNGAGLDGVGLDGTNVRFVSRYATRSYPTDKRDRIRLYPSDSTDSGSDTLIGRSSYVECASCHNPHTPRPLFLRLPTVSSAGNVGYAAGGDGVTFVTDVTLTDPDLSHNPNQGSLVCLSCHQK